MVPVKKFDGKRDRKMKGWKDKPKTVCPCQLFKVGGIMIKQTNKKKCERQRIIEKQEHKMQFKINRQDIYRHIS